MFNKLTIDYYFFALLIAAGLWLSGIYSLMVTPVWDEVAFMSDAHRFSSFLGNVYFYWFDYKLYRPIANTLMEAGLWLLPSDMAWRFLRIVNAAMVIASFWCIADAAKRQYGKALSSTMIYQRSPKNLSQSTLFSYWMVVFLSPSALIVATWFPNIFDASCLLLMALGLGCRN